MAEKKLEAVFEIVVRATYKVNADPEHLQEVYGTTDLDEAAKVDEGNSPMELLCFVDEDTPDGESTWTHSVRVVKRPGESQEDKADPYTRLARALFECSEVNDRQKEQAKQVFWNHLFQQGAKTLADKIGEDFQTASALLVKLPAVLDTKLDEEIRRYAAGIRS